MTNEQITLLNFKNREEIGGSLLRCPRCSAILFIVPDAVFVSDDMNKIIANITPVQGVPQGYTSHCKICRESTFLPVAIKKERI